MGLMDIRRRILADAPQLATASGAVASFSTDMAAKLKACQFSIEPVQSGTGDPSPSNVRPISGWTGANISRTGANIWDEQTELGVLNSDGSVSDNQTRLVSKNFIPIKEGMSYCYVVPNGAGRGVFYDENKNPVQYYYDFPTTYYPNTGIGYFTAPAGAKYLKICLYTSYGTTYNNNVSINYPATDSEYHPYTAGQIAVEFPALGVNQWDEQWEVGGISTSTGGNISQDRLRSKNYVPLVVGQTYYLHNGPVANMIFYWYDQNKNYVTYGSMGTSSQTFVAAYPYLRFVDPSGTTYSNNISINYPATATSYEPYTNTVYGGTLDLTTGVLTVDRVAVDMGTLTWSAASGGTSHYTTLSDAVSDNNANAICSTFAVNMDISGWADLSVGECGMRNKIFRVYDNTGYDAAAFKTAMDGVQLVYELATPVTYQLTPQQITALKGANNVWCDTGNTTVKYWKH